MRKYTLAIVNPKTGEEFQGYGNDELIAWIEGKALIQVQKTGIFSADMGESADQKKRPAGEMVTAERSKQTPLQKPHEERRLKFANKKVENLCEAVTKLLKAISTEEEEKAIEGLNDLFIEKTSDPEIAIKRALQRIEELRNAVDDIALDFELRSMDGGN